MDFPPIDPAAARSRLSDWQERTERMAADTQELSAQMQSLRAKAADDKELAEATVDHTGSLVDLVFSARIKRVSEEEGAAAVLEAVQRAKELLAERSHEVVESTVGSDSPAGQALVNGLKRQFGTDEDDQGGGRY